jgi:hypothetical protein
MRRREEGIKDTQDLQQDHQDSIACTQENCGIRLGQKWIPNTRTIKVKKKHVTTNIK